MFKSFIQTALILVIGLLLLGGLSRIAQNVGSGMHAGDFAKQHSEMTQPLLIQLDRKDDQIDAMSAENVMLRKLLTEHGVTHPEWPGQSPQD